MIKLFSVISFLVLTFSVEAQSTEERVQTLFEGTDSAKTIKFFRGRLNDINDVMIALGSNGREYKGIMKYLRSNEEFIVDGKVQGKTLNLSERDKSGNLTGIITGTIEKFEGITAEWFNHDRTIGADLRLIPYRVEPKYPTYCGDNKWIRVYDGMIGDEYVQFILKRGNGFRVDGLAYFENLDKTYSVEGVLTNYNRDIELEIQDNNLNGLGIIKGKVDFKTDNIEGKFKNDRGEIQSSHLKKGKTLSVGCIEYADFISEMEVTYPKTRSLKFNAMLNDYIQDWLKTSREYTRQYKKQMSNPEPELRASLRSYFWCDIDYFSNSIISGKATHTNTWEKGYDSYVFNFDFNSNKVIALEDIFKSGSDYKKFIDDYIQQEMKLRPFASDEIFQKWMRTASFPYFTIRKDGINFTSAFNAIFGEQHCTIPFENLKPYLKADSPVATLVK